ncbi:DUF4362 domain-containing protein [Bacillus sp. CGMCC 1.16607]|uniref:DUF4362 domain-containing protein n=1 Tax=Bacillus sp. CGMCC 1.16607 TaxID=3351842 RepID=UPI0036327B1D
MRKYIYLFIISIFMLSACGTRSPITKEPVTNTFKDHEIINVHGNVKNLKRLDQFVKLVSDGVKDSIRITNYTIEGDPIFNEVVYDEKQLTITNDTTEDKFGPKERTTYTCKNIERNETDSELVYMLMDCEATDGTKGDKPLLKIRYNLAEQDYFAFRLEHGVNQKNIIDTKEQKLVKDLQNGELATVSDFQFTKVELQQIYKLLVLAGYLGEKKFSHDCHEEPNSTYLLKVWINQGEREYGWNRCDKSSDGQQMTKMADAILEVLKENETYEQLPEIKGYYK